MISPMFAKKNIKFEEREREKIAYKVSFAPEIDFISCQEAH